MPAEKWDRDENKHIDTLHASIESAIGDRKATRNAEENKNPFVCVL